MAQNIFLGQTRGIGIVPRAAHRQKASELLRGLAPHLHVDAQVESLGMADRQLVEISRTLARGGRIIAFDEPTSSLTPAEQVRCSRSFANCRPAVEPLYTFRTG